MLIIKCFSFFMGILVTILSFFGVHLSEKSIDPEMVSFDPLDKTITFSLDENPSTGYVWSFAQFNKSVLSIVDNSFSSDAPVGIIGAGGKRTIVLEAKRAGISVLALQYHRPWERESIRTLVIQCTVSADLTISAVLLADISRG